MYTEPDDPAPTSAVDQSPSIEQPLDWLLAALQQAMEELLAGDATPLQKASTAARLGTLYLKTYQTAAIEKENHALKDRVAELEQRLAGAHDEIAHMHAVAADWVQRLEQVDSTARPCRERAGLPYQEEVDEAEWPVAPFSIPSATVSRFDAIRTVTDPPRSGVGAEVADPPDP